MTICYIRGSSNTIPDSLSRLFQDSSPQERRENEATYMHDVEDFILPVTTRFQNRASLDIDGRTDAPRTERAPTQQQPPGPQPSSSSSREETLYTGVTRDDTMFPHAAQVPSGDQKTPPETSEMNSPCGTQQAQDTPHVPASSADAAALRPDVPLVHSMQRDENSDLSIRHDGFIDSNCAVDNKVSLTDVTFPVISSSDYATDAEFSGMFLYLHDGTLSGNVKKDKPILIMEDRYVIDEDGLLYRVDTPRQKTLASLKPMTKRLCCLLYTSPSPRDRTRSRMPSSA